MLVLPLDKIEPSESTVVLASVKNGSQQILNEPQNTKLIIPEKTFDTSVTRVLRQIELRDKKQSWKKEIPKKEFDSGTITRDSLWNIYTGNPGLYSAEGDTAGFGNVSYLPDSLFFEKRLSIAEKSRKPYGKEGKSIDFPEQDWLFGFVIIAWMIFASVRVGFGKYLDQLISSMVNFNVAARLYRERGYKTFYGAVRLNLLFYLVLPLSVFQIAHFYNVNLPGYPDFFLFLILFLLINGYFFIKILIYRVVGSIVMLKEEANESDFNIQLYYKALGIFLLPVVTIHAIGKEIAVITVWISISLIGIFYFASVVRSIYIGNKKGISIFYLILYLCILEILPLMIIFKILTKE